MALFYSDPKHNAEHEAKLSLNQVVVILKIGVYSFISHPTVAFLAASVAWCTLM